MKKNLFLDLDNCLIFSHHEEDDIHNFKFTQDNTLYCVLERDNLEAFLDFCFKNFKVSVYTAAIKEYATPICENTFKKYQGQFTLLTREDCVEVKNDNMYSMAPVRYLKHIPKDSIIVDDNIQNVVLDTGASAIQVSAFHYAPYKDDVFDLQDDELLRVIEQLKKFL